MERSVSPPPATPATSPAPPAAGAGASSPQAMHLRPAGGWFGDPIPFYWHGTYHLFYLVDREHHAQPGGRHTWGHFASEDLVRWRELPLAIDLGAPGAVDAASCGTGAIIERGAVFHLYYLGRSFDTSGERRETMCHATSRDLVVWEKDPGNPISAPDERQYHPAHWRDGFPFWNEAAGEYWMLVTAALAREPAGRAGCLALLASESLSSWELRGPYWAPGLMWAMECPDLFEWGGWWYLLYSGTMGGRNGTFYRRSRSTGGPWEAMPVDGLDGPMLYAAKTAGDGARRFLFGWVPTREGDADTGRRQWGGHSTVREVVQDESGALWLRCPPELLALGGQPAHAVARPLAGEWRTGPASAACSRWDGVSLAGVPAAGGDVLVRCRFSPEGPGGSGEAGPVQRFGLIVRASEDLGSGYRIEVQPRLGRLALYGFGPPRAPQLEPVSCPLPDVQGRDVELVVFVSGTLLDVFADGRAALAARIYDHRGDTLGLFVEGGGGTFRDLTVAPLEPDV